MNVVIPKTLQKQVRERARKHGVSERDYVAQALTRFIESDDTANFYQKSGFDADLAEELALWNRASQEDFEKFAQKHKL